MATIGSLYIDLVANTSRFATDMDGAVRQARRTGLQMQDVGKTLTAGLTVPIVGIGTAAVLMATEFNKSMANVASLIPGNQQRVTELKSAVQNLAIETGKSTTDMAAGLYEVVSAFGDTADSVTILRINAQAATGGLSSTTEAIRLTSAVTKAYGDMSAEAVQKVSDLSLLTVRLGQTTFPELAGAMGRVVPLTAELKVSQEELFAVMATGTGVTGTASEVSTQLRGVLQALMAPTKDMTNLFGEMGVSSGKALLEQEGLHGTIRLLTQTAEASGIPLQKFIGSIEGQTLALALAGPQAEVFREKLGEMENAAGATLEAFNEQTQGVNKLGFQYDQAVQRMAVMAQRLGDALAPALDLAVRAMEPLLSALESAVAWFAKLPASAQLVIVVMAGLFAAIGPVVFVAGHLIASFSALLPLLAKMPAILAANSAAFTLLGKAGLVAAAAFVGWQIGTLIGELEVVQVAAQNFFTSWGVGSTVVRNANSSLEATTIKAAATLKDKYGIEVDRAGRSVEAWNTEVTQALISMRQQDPVVRAAAAATKVKSEADQVAAVAVQQVVSEQQKMIASFKDSINPSAELAAKIATLKTRYDEALIVKVLASEIVNAANRHRELGTAIHPVVGALVAEAQAAITTAEGMRKLNSETAFQIDLQKIGREVIEKGLPALHQNALALSALRTQSEILGTTEEKTLRQFKASTDALIFKTGAEQGAKSVTAAHTIVLNEQQEQLNDHAQAARENAKTATQWGAEWAKEISLTFDRLKSRIADAIVDWEGFGSALIASGKSFLKATLEIFLGELFNPLKAWMASLAKSFSGWLQGLFTGTQSALGGIGGLFTKLIGGLAAAGPWGAVIAAGVGAALAIKATWDKMPGWAQNTLRVLVPIFGAISLLVKTTEEKVRAEFARDFGGVKIATNDVKEFGKSLGLTMKQIDGIRKDLSSSPVFLQMAFDAAQAQGKTAEFLTSLESVQTAWGSFNFRTAFEEGLDTGNWEALNEAFIAAFEGSERLADALRGDLSPLLLATQSGAKRTAAQTNAMAEALENLRGVPARAAEEMAVLVEQIEALNDLGATNEEVWTILGPAIDSMIETFKDLNLEIPEAITNLIGLQKANVDLGDEIGDVAAEIVTLVRTSEDLGDVIGDVAPKMVTVVEELVRTSEDLGDEIGDVAAEIVTLVRTSEDLGDVIGDVGAMLLILDLDPLTDRLADMALAFGLVGDEFDSFEAGFRSIAKASRDLDSRWAGLAGKTMALQELFANLAPIQAQQRAWELLGNEFISTFNEFSLMGQAIPPFLQQIITWAQKQGLLKLEQRATTGAMVAQRLELVKTADEIFNVVSAWDMLSEAQKRGRTSANDLLTASAKLSDQVEAFNLELESSGIPAQQSYAVTWHQFGDEILRHIELYTKLGLPIDERILQAKAWADANGLIAKTADEATSALKRLSETESAMTGANRQAEATAGTLEFLRQQAATGGTSFVNTEFTSGRISPHLGITFNQGISLILQALQAGFSAKHIGLAAALITGGRASSLSGALEAAEPFVGSFQHGGIVPFEGLVQAHPGELFIPEEFAQSTLTMFRAFDRMSDIFRPERMADVQSAIRSEMPAMEGEGRPAVHFHINAIDGASVRRVTESEILPIIEQMWEGDRQGRRTRARRALRLS